MGNKPSFPPSPSASPHSKVGSPEITKKKVSVPKFMDFCSVSHEEMKRLVETTPEDRVSSHVLVSDVKTEQVQRVEPMTFWEELAVALFLAFSVPNCVFTIPPVTYLVGKFVLGDVALAFKALGIMLLPLVILPQPFVPSTLQSWLAHKFVKYFSFRFAYDVYPPTQQPGGGPNEERPQILVAPPHGVFPYVNILTMVAWPSMTGHHFFGLAANSALRTPIIKQVMRSIGVINADRETARKALDLYPHTIGISTGGVAEVFETNNEHECVLLKSRVGLIKLAIRTGADLVPCYAFGNTELMSCWSGEGIPGAHWLLEKISRKVGFALIVIHGRFGLPIPRRVPTFGVIGKPIPTAHLQCEEPTTEQIAEVQGKLIDAVQDLFERYKTLYGWEDRDLIIR